MKRVLKWFLIALGALFLVALGASLASPEGREGLQAGLDAAESTAAIPTTAPPTAEPSLPPTPEPTPAATPKSLPPLPTPEPTIATTGHAEWVAYSVDRLAWLENEYQPALQAWDTSGDNPFVTAMNAIDIWIALGNEQVALDIVEPHPCFVDWHEKWSEVIDLYYEGYDILTDGGIESDLAKINEGIAITEQANAKLNESNAAMEATAVACSGQ